jgi:hypothetical protein
MSQILQIVRKDLRRQRLEILGYCVAVAAWALQTAHPGAFEWFQQRELLPILLFGLWGLLTIRAVQGESLVGDREWWPTRPYRWGKLLAAKFLFLVIALNGPLLIAQLYLLSHAGIPIGWSLLPGLIFLNGMFVLFVTFPVAVLASVTESIVQWVMSVVGIMLAVVVFSWLPWSKLPPTLAGQQEISTWTIALVLLPAMIAALLWQYARRREWPARILLAAALALIPLGTVLRSTPQAFRLAYPESKPGNSMKLAIQNSASGVREFDWDDNANKILIPLADTALGSDEAIHIDGYRLHLAGSGWQWDSEWQNDWGDNLAFFEPSFSVQESLPEWVYTNVKYGIATAQVEVAWESYRLNPAVQARAGSYGTTFAVPGIGSCHVETNPGNLPRKYSIWPACAAPLTLPPVYLIAIDSDGNQCGRGDGTPQVPAGHTAYALDFGSSAPADFDLNPVRKFSLLAGNWIPALLVKQGQSDYRDASVCPGGSFIIRTGQALGHQRATFNLGDVGVAKTHKAGETIEDGTVTFKPDEE